MSSIKSDEALPISNSFDFRGPNCIVRKIGGYLETAVTEEGAKILAILGGIILIVGLLTGAIGTFDKSSHTPTPTPMEI